MTLSEGVDIRQIGASAQDGERGLEKISGQPQDPGKADADLAEARPAAPVKQSASAAQLAEADTSAGSKSEAPADTSAKAQADTSADTSSEATPNLSPRQWFVMRDLKRANAKLPAYRQLLDAGLEVFTPMHTVLKSLKGRQRKVVQPVIRDLLFVHETRAVLDPIVEVTPTLQYRFERGKGYMVPMVVRDEDMQKFLLAVSSAKSAVYLLPEEMTPKMIGRTIRITGGPLEGFTGKLVSIKGSRARRLMVAIPDILVACVEIETRYVEIL